MNFMINGRMNCDIENPTQHFTSLRDTNKKNFNQIRRHRNLNSEPPEYTTSVLPLRHLARHVFTVYCFAPVADIATSLKPFLMS